MAIFQPPTGNCSWSGLMSQLRCPWNEHVLTMGLAVRDAGNLFAGRSDGEEDAGVAGGDARTQQVDCESKHLQSPRPPAVAFRRCAAYDWGDLVSPSATQSAAMGPQHTNGSQEHYVRVRSRRQMGTDRSELSSSCSPSLSRLVSSFWPHSDIVRHHVRSIRRMH